MSNQTQNPQRGGSTSSGAPLSQRQNTNLLPPQVPNSSHPIEERKHSSSQYYSPRSGIGLLPPSTFNQQRGVSKPAQKVAASSNMPPLVGGIQQPSQFGKGKEQAHNQNSNGGAGAAMIDMDDPSCISFSENIDESPNRKISGLGGITDKLANQAPTVHGYDPKQTDGTILASHFKIYEFNYNEQKTQKSAMSSTDRSHKAQTSNVPIQQEKPVIKLHGKHVPTNLIARSLAGEKPQGVNSQQQNNDDEEPPDMEMDVEDEVINTDQHSQHQPNERSIQTHSLAIGGYQYGNEMQDTEQEVEEGVTPTRGGLLGGDPVDEDENLFELEIKNLDTNEVFKMQIPISDENMLNSSGSLSNGRPSANPNYASKRRQHHESKPSMGLGSPPALKNQSQSVRFM
ncbi:hypothetical protein FGO68_gene1595 [Halteria grandinella]|uniref:Uncharacterized protein n=1 Tax=Halteria grandinella TaxID=5974 RepID=A0A8J8NXA0_HALGN|nr:hypothetical protein FGO68_gene1595 [Halteria grandinella]